MITFSINILKYHFCYLNNFYKIGGNKILNFHSKLRLEASVLKEVKDFLIFK